MTRMALKRGDRGSLPSVLGSGRADLPCWMPLSMPVCLGRMEQLPKPWRVPRCRLAWGNLVWRRLSTLELVKCFRSAGFGQHHRLQVLPRAWGGAWQPLLGRALLSPELSSTYGEPKPTGSSRVCPQRCCGW